MEWYDIHDVRKDSAIDAVQHRSYGILDCLVNVGLRGCCPKHAIVFALDGPGAPQVEAEGSRIGSARIVLRSCDNNTEEYYRRCT